MSDELLKFQLPDRDYPPELVAQIAASLLGGGQTIEDCELAVARALRLLDTVHAVLERHKRERDNSRDRGEPKKHIPFGEALRRITGATRPSTAEERFLKFWTHRGFEYTDYDELRRASGKEVPRGHDPLAPPEVKVHKPASKEVKQALAIFREKGFEPAHVERLREQYIRGAARSRASSFSKKNRSKRK
jgi:hypothetical protein